MTIGSFVTSRFGLRALAAWLVWYGGMLAIRAYVRSLKDPSLYSGACRRPNGYVLECSLEQWLVWDAAPYLGIYGFVGGLVAAAFTGRLFLQFLAQGGAAPRQPPH